MSISAKSKIIPKLRFPEFTDEWEVKKLGDLDIYVSDGNYGEMYPKASEMTASGVAFIRANNLKGGSLTWEDMKYISPDLHSVLTSGHLKTGDTLVTTRGDIGTISYVTPDFDGANINAQLCLLRPVSGLDDRYLFQSLQTHKSKSQFVQLQTGSALKQLPKGKLALLTIGISEKKEQEKIAEFLTVLDERIGVINKKLELLQKYKKGIMQKIFTQKIRFKDENGNIYPDWQTKKLGDISERVIHKNRAGIVNFVLTNSATEGIVSQIEYFEKDIANKANLANYTIVSVDDFVYNPRISVHAPVGPIKRNHLSEGVVSPLYSVFRIVNASEDFFEHYFETNYWYDYLKGVANSGARHDRMNITNLDLYSMSLPFPCIEEQQKIADFLNALDDKIKAEENKLQQAKTYKRALLQRMFI